MKNKGVPTDIGEMELGLELKTNVPSLYIYSSPLVTYRAVSVLSHLK